MKKILFLGLVLSVSGCVTQLERENAVKERASFDLNCPKENIKLTTLLDDSILTGKVKFGAEGCEKRMVFDTLGKDVYAEGAAPNPVLINPYQVKPYTPSPSTYKPYGSRY